MKALKKIYIALIMLFLYAPMLVMVVFSFNASNSTSVMSGFSLKWYVEMFRNATALTALRNTLVLAVTSALISIIIGTAAAVGNLPYVILSVLPKLRQTLAERSSGTILKYLHNIEQFRRYLPRETAVTKETVIAYKRALRRNMP